MTVTDAAPRQLSLGWLTVTGAHPLEHIAAAVAGRFQAVGLRLVPPGPQDAMVPVVGDEPLIREIQASLGATGIAVLDVETVWIGPDFEVSSLARVMDVAQRLGARHLLTMGNDPDESRLRDHFAALCELAARFDLQVGLEFAAYTHVPNLQAADRLTQAAGQANGRILVDTLHFVRSGGAPMHLAAVDPCRIAYCQLADARGPTPASPLALRAEARGGRHLPGEGELALGAILNALPTGSPLVVEAPCAELVHLSIVERGAAAGAATHRFLERLAQGNET